jgi:uncharacterized protein YjeT (DUF2065 family)
MEARPEAEPVVYGHPRRARQAAGGILRWVTNLVRRALLALVAAGLAVASVPTVRASAEPAAPPPTVQRRAYVVAAMGDSLSDPKSQGAKYLEPLRTACPKSRFDAYGVGGNMTNMMKKRFSRDVLGDGGDGTKPKYTHVLVLGGIGDILSNETAKRTATTIERDLGAMYAMAKERGLVVVAMTLPPWGAFKAYDSARHQMTLDVNAWLRGGPPNVDTVVDIFPLLSCGDANKLCRDYAWPDQLHWNPKGHQVVAAELAKRVFSDCE